MDSLSSSNHSGNFGFLQHTIADTASSYFHLFSSLRLDIEKLLDVGLSNNFGLHNFGQHVNETCADIIHESVDNIRCENLNTILRSKIANGTRDGN